MIARQNELPIGESIRRARRERNLTQTELGGTDYSKSYISAVEHAKILPSHEALQFFAGQLNLPETFFTSLGEPAGLAHSPGASMEEQTPFDTRKRAITDEPWYLLDMLLEQTPRWNIQAFRELPPFSIEILDAMPASRQASYAFLLGTIAQQKGEFSQALRALEYALEHAPPQQRFVILDAMGSNYALQRMDSLALHYHLEAHLLLKQETLVDSSSPLSLNIALHCAEDYQALGSYQQATTMYEDARLHLNAEHSMRIAAELYLGLGYCAYALVRHIATLATPQRERLTVEEMDQGYQGAISLFLDSVFLSQLAGNRLAEVAARLLLCIGVLDWCAGLRQKSSTGGGAHSERVEERCASLLDQAEEHCRRILLACQGDFNRGNIVPEQEKQSIFPVLASVVRIFAQRAGIARMEGHSKIVSHELALASYLCNHTLDRLFDASFPLSSIEMALALRTAHGIAFAPVLPALPNKATFNMSRSALDQVEVYLAAGEVAEELGRAADKPAYAGDCYERADRFFLEALEHASSVVTRREQDPGYLTRCYQRCISFLEERVADVQAIRKESTSELLHFFKSELQRLPDLLHPVDRYAN